MKYWYTTIENNTLKLKVFIPYIVTYNTKTKIKQVWHSTYKSKAQAKMFVEDFSNELKSHKIYKILKTGMKTKTLKINI